MIGRLSGRLDHRAADHVLIDVRGVGYIVYCSERTLSGLPRVGEAVSLFTDLVRVGRSSMRIHVQAWRRERHRQESEKVTEATFTFVALDEAGRPREVTG